MTVPSFTPASIRPARALARAFGHGWATDPIGPTDAEILGGVVAAVEAWEGRLADLDAADPDGGHEHLKWRGLAPATEHTSHSGTVRWAVAATGAVTVTVSVAAHYPVPADAGRVLWAIAVAPDGTVTGGMTPGAVWPPLSQGWEEGCAASACKALGVPSGWIRPIPLPPVRPLVVKGPVRRL
jgi:hypothetical protein